jgi:hypothetical protein
MIQIKLHMRRAQQVGDKYEISNGDKILDLKHSWISSRRWKKINEIPLKETELEDLVWIQLAKTTGQEAAPFEHSTTLSGSIKNKIFLKPLSDYWLLKDGPP